jgi:hypothetical protein
MFAALIDTPNMPFVIRLMKHVVSPLVTIRERDGLPLRHRLTNGRRLLFRAPCTRRSCCIATTSSSTEHRTGYGPCRPDEA